MWVNKGFTLIELFIVIAIVGILASVGMHTYTKAQTEPSISKVRVK